MGKNQAKKHLHSRISFLYQAATSLSAASSSVPSDAIPSTSEINQIIAKPETAPNASIDSGIRQTQPEAGDIDGEADKRMSATAGLSRLYVAHLRSVSRKAVIRLSPEMKHTICKRCNAILEPGSTSSIQVDNASRGGRKPHADVLAISCNACGLVKRFPVSARRQRSRKSRASGGNKTSRRVRSTHKWKNR